MDKRMAQENHTPHERQDEFLGVYLTLVSAKS